MPPTIPAIAGDFQFDNRIVAGLKRLLVIQTRQRKAIS
jgi:hypothetical protein